MTRPITILGLGGTLRPSSSGASALRVCLEFAAHRGCRTEILTGEALNLPIYDPAERQRTAAATTLVNAVRRADGVIVATPGYHGSMSGLVKNVLDFLEDLRDDQRCYLTDVPVGCIVSAGGWQACGLSLVALRSVIHSLRGWPTPLGVAFTSSEAKFDESGACTDPSLRLQLEAMTEQVVSMATWRRSGAAVGA
jgi:FMN reductase